MFTKIATKELKDLWTGDLPAIDREHFHLERMELVEELNSSWMPEGMHHLTDIPEMFWECTARHYNLKIVG